MVEVKERPKERSRSERTEAMAIRKIGIVGAGQMGNGIAHVCALSGFHVLLNDIAPDRITEGLATINGNLARQVSRQRISDEQRQAAIKRIAPANTLGLHRVMFAVDDIDDLVARMRAHGAELIGEMRYGDSYRLAYLRGPEGIIVGLAEQL